MSYSFSNRFPALRLPVRRSYRGVLPERAVQRQEIGLISTATHSALRTFSSAVFSPSSPLHHPTLLEIMSV